jgi:signal transduction histidine kinase
VLGLRERIVLAFLLFGLLLSSGFAAIAYVAMDDFEGIVVRQLLQSEMQQVIDSRRLDAHAPLPASRRMYARVVPLEAVQGLPARLRALPPGIRVLDEDGEHETYVEVRDADARRFYYFIDLGDVAERESFVHWLLAAIVILGTLASGALGLLFAGTLMAPVQRLSRWVDASVPEHPSGAWASRFADDEVGALAAAFDRYQRRLDAFLQREREFTADASHELRSPLSVLKAGMDLIAEDRGLGERGRRALVRMQRRAAELNGLLDVMLYVARAESGAAPASAPIPLLRTWRQLLDERSAEPAGVPVQLRGDDAAVVIAPPRTCAVIFDHLLAQAVRQAAGDELHVDVAAGCIVLGPLSTTGAAVDGSGQARSDERLGLALIARACARLGWELQLARQPSRLVLAFVAETGREG